jgi:tetratricopeptide (TPR) repeat protein
MKKYLSLTLLLLSAPALAAPAAAPAPAPMLAPAAQSDLYLGVVEGLIRQERYQAAIAFLAKYQKNQASTPRYNKLVGDALLGAGRYGEAVAAYRQILKSQYAADAYNGIGRALSAQGDWAAAGENFRQAAMNDPANAMYLNNFGYAQLQQNFRGPQLSSVIGELQRAHELDPNSVLIRDNLALALNLGGQDSQFHALLGGIAEENDRKKVAEFAARWTPMTTAAAAKADVP